MNITSRNIKKKVLRELQCITFPKCKTRKNVSSSTQTSFVLGEVNYRGQKYLNGKTRGPSSWNTKFPELFELCKRLIQFHKPEFSYTTIQVNRNVQCSPHIDKNNVGPSYIIALGKYTGGELLIEGSEYNIRNRWKYFNGHKGHWVNPFEGERYSLVFFTHTFKPPCSSTRNIKVTKDGLYKKDVLQIKYK